MTKINERSKVYQAVEKHRSLVHFLIQRFDLFPLDNLQFQKGLPFLDAAGDLDSRMEFDVGANSSLNLIFSDFSDYNGCYWLKRFTQYEAGLFGGDSAEHCSYMVIDTPLAKAEGILVSQTELALPELPQVE